MSQSIAEIYPHHNGDLLSQPYRGYDEFTSQSLLTAPIPSFPSYAYPPPVSSGLANAPNNLSGNPGSIPLGETSPAPQVSWNSTAPSAPQRESFDFQLPASGTSAASAPEEVPMRYLHSNLGVLSAEQYDDGRYPKRAASKVRAKPTVTVVPIDDAPNPRKRGRNRADGGTDESVEETKRSRGRPRLETKDQTPTERRRTQIRLAQRAYRNRKESAITDLQAKISDLKDVNNEINSAYQDLFNYASGRGLLAQAPEFGQQLQRLQTLIKQTQEKDSPKDSEEEESTGNSDDNVPEARSAEVVAPPPPEEREAVPVPPEPQVTQQLLDGLMVSHEPVVQHPVTHQHAEAPAASYLDPSLVSAPAHEYEIITAPTPDNASFGPTLSVDPSFWGSAQANWAVHPWNRLTGPRTLATSEWAFARRLHRQTVERALSLVSMPNPPPARMSRVFGFVMLFETLDEIRARTRATLDRIRDEPLNYWEHPFHQLGGSGTHFSDQVGGPSSLAGASGYESTGFGMGPFNERTTHVRDTFLGVSQYINMSGWEGTWFDAGEVETYLAQNGVVIPTAADVHTIEVQPGAFADVQSQPQIQLMQSIPPTSAPMPYATQAFDPGPSHNMPPPMDTTSYSNSMNTQMHTNQAAAQHDLWPPISVTSNLYGAPQTADGGIPSFTGYDNMGFSNSPSYLFPHHEHTAPAPMPPAKRVMLDVNNFINSLISHTTCLGRAPAFRPKDIVSSFWGAVIADENI
ncbi:hypothetical protein GGR53DRAFT_491808 [Hypoxylon sp. FL1150]|nr:hypothetical protein GGR53DRAFT_491808 [Hypoxylon sp. FL1150]